MSGQRSGETRGGAGATASSAFTEAATHAKKGA
jgi:hypothetical protein